MKNICVNFAAATLKNEVTLISDTCHTEDPDASHVTKEKSHEQKDVTDDPTPICLPPITNK